jgi:hypothetical protein
MGGTVTALAAVDRTLCGMSCLSSVPPTPRRRSSARHRIADEADVPCWSGATLSVFGASASSKVSVAFAWADRYASRSPEHPSAAG